MEFVAKLFILLLSPLLWAAPGRVHLLDECGRAGRRSNASGFINIYKLASLAGA